MRITRLLTIVAAAVFGAILFAGSGIAGGVNVGAGGLGIKGYDPVAYFTSGSAKKGSGAHTSRHAGVTYRFSSAKNKAAFDRNPGKYAPAYGGFCAYGVAQGYKVGINPRAFKVVGGKLYLNASPSIQRTWAKNASSYIKSANKNWPRL